MEPHKIVSHEQWIDARKAHLKNEKALTRMRDLVSAERRALPWVKVEKDMSSTPPRQEDARRAVRPQQPADHPSFHVAARSGSGCPSCSLEADHAEGAIVHLENHDVSYVRVSRAPLAELPPTSGAWAGPPNGFRHGAATSITTITCRSRKDELATGEVYYNYRMTKDGFDELPGLSVFAKDDAGNVYPHLFELCPRQRGGEWRLHLSRHDAEGPQRDRDHGLGETARRIVTRACHAKSA